jgi:hypothetical protein
MTKMATATKLTARRAYRRWLLASARGIQSSAVHDDQPDHRDG